MLTLNYIKTGCVTVVVGHML